MYKLMVHPFYVVEEKTLKSLSFCQVRKQPSKRKTLAYFKQEKLIALDENETVNAIRSKIEDNGKDEPACQKLPGRTINHF